MDLFLNAMNLKQRIFLLMQNNSVLLDAPFIQMSFLSLPVIPSLKITDKGLVDVDAFKIIEPIQKQMK